MPPKPKKNSITYDDFISALNELSEEDGYLAFQLFMRSSTSNEEASDREDLGILGGTATALTVINAIFGRKPSDDDKISPEIDNERGIVNFRKGGPPFEPPGPPTTASTKKKKDMGKKNK